jgi:uncharacterized protein YoxC
MNLSPLDIALMCLVVAGIFAVIEIALTVRKAGRTIDSLSKSVTDTIDEVQPTITKLDGIVDELGPASKRIDPLIAKAETAVDALSLDLMDVDRILGDVSTVTGTGANVSNAVAGAAEHVAAAVSSVAGKVTGRTEPAAGIQGASEPSQLEGPAQGVADVEGDDGYFTYPTDGKGKKSKYEDEKHEDEKHEEAAADQAAPTSLPHTEGTID